MRALFGLGSFLGFCSLFLHDVSGNDIYPTAQNVSWSSHNFKTLLTWSPEPTGYSYTVEYSVLGKDHKKNPHCIRTTQTECDLTMDLTELNQTYSADVVSEPKLGDPLDVEEYPYTKSERFCPYKDTTIGKPNFTFEVNESKNKITLHIQDPVSAIRGANNELLKMREIFKEELKYKVFYSKAKSTGKKEKVTMTNEIELDVDKGQSYCFSVQAYIPTRAINKQLGELSKTQCSPEEKSNIFEEYGLGVIAGGIIILIIILLSIICLITYFCKRRAKAIHKEAMPLNAV
ncbi:coagulation factor III, tissue factor a [Amia ocellicauda]|uniref:coagulation factor III, tissue factor a n=1 Tax=Amia ocellicauda TaxID=2972642 RepID=UPI003463921C